MRVLNDYKSYKVTIGVYYNEILLDVVVAEKIKGNKRSVAERIGEAGEVILYRDKIHITHEIVGDFDIRDEERSLYQFLICKKKTKPIDIDKLSSEEILDLIDNEDYMTTSDDYLKVDWNISQVYKILKEQYPLKDYFIFDSSNYGIEELED